MPNYIEFNKSQSDLYPTPGDAGVVVLGVSASNEIFLKSSNGNLTVLSSQVMPIVLEAKIDTNATPITRSYTPNITVSGLTSGSTVVSSTNFINRQVEVFKNGNLLPGINLGSGEYITKPLTGNTITFTTGLASDDYIKIKCL